MKNILLLVSLTGILLIQGCGSDNQVNTPVRLKNDPKNIILFIGDGMGIAQVSAAISKSDKHLFIESFPYSGFSITYSADNYITDSAAGGTAISTGSKTRNGMIGVDETGAKLKTIMEVAHMNGLATGLISTTAITHATPASFVAHNAGRGNYEDIANDFMNNTIDVFIGGGMSHFKVRRDSADLTLKLKEDGYDVVYTLEDMKNSDSDKLAALLDSVDMPKVLDGRGPMLEEATRKAIETLGRNDNGFILMVEGSFIDKGGHDNDIDYSVSELIDMDKAVGVALDFAKQNGETTIIVTADHETGGLTLVASNPFLMTDTTVYSSRGHSSVMVPIFSYGPGAEEFSGIHDNTFFYDKFVKLLKLEDYFPIKY